MEITKEQAEDFYKNLCRIVYGDENIKGQGMMNIPWIAYNTGMDYKTTEEYCKALIKYGITNGQGSMILV